MTTILIGGVAASQSGYQFDGAEVTGSNIRVHSNCWLAGSPVSVTLGPDSPVLLGTLIANSEGVIDGEFAIPAGTKPGSYTITLSGTDCNKVPKTQVFDITIGKGNLAFTGSSDIGTTLGVGAALVILGSTAIVGFRRRRSTLTV